MGSRLFWRRSATAVGLYTSTLLGILGTVVAARVFSLVEFGLYATVMVATGFFQSLLDLTVEESLTKYGFRYATAEDWGKLRRLFRRALQLKLAGGVLAGLALLALAPAADWIFGAEGLALPLVIAAALPLAQAPENVAATALLLRGRYDLRGACQTFSMGLRLVAIAVGTQFGLAETMAGIVVAQVAATAFVGLVGAAAFRRFPRIPAASLADDRRNIFSFVLQSSAATGLISVRMTLAPLLLGIAAGPTQVGYFRIAQAPQTGFLAASAPVRLILLTEQTRYWERGEISRVLAGVRRYSLAAAGVTLVAVPVFLWLMPTLIELAFKAKYLPATDAARIILVAAAIHLVFGWTKSFPVSIGRPGLRLVTHGIETAVLLPLVIVLGVEWGATGAAAAILVSAVAFAFAWSVLYLRISREPRPIQRTREAVTP
jgi:O-antigen/teichoic acid export membrane protein